MTMASGNIADNTNNDIVDIVNHNDKNKTLWTS